MENYQYLKDLVCEYNDHQNPAIFEEIVIKVEKLLYKTIHLARRNRPYLRKIDFQELYQTAIVGLHQALNSVKVDEPGSKILYRIVRYVRNEIGKQHKWTKKVSFPFSIAQYPFQVHLFVGDLEHSMKYIIQIEESLVDKTEAYAGIESEWYREKFAKLIEDEIISPEEFTMICMRFADGASYKYISDQLGCSAPTVSRKIKKALNRLRFEFRRRNWEEI